MKVLLGWHFLRADKKLGYGDNRLVRTGHTFKIEPPIMLCERGFHASQRALDAVANAPGPIVCSVLLSGEVIEGANKAVATKRTVLWMADATDVLFEFACWAAEAALIGQITQGRAVDPRSWAAIETRRRCMRGEATDAELSAAWDAAQSAAQSAAWGAAWCAAESAARNAAWGAVCAAQSAAWRAARSAARNAAWCAAESAARNAAWGAVCAAQSAAWCAARSAAESAQNAELERRLRQLAPKGSR